MIKPGTHNVTCFQGATFDLDFTVKLAGTAINLTGYTARMQVRETAEAGTAVLSLATAGSGITLGGTAGSISTTVAATATAAIEAGSYVYDMELVSGSVVTRILQGGFKVLPEVTR
jgi:hypothetical protein